MKDSKHNWRPRRDSRNLDVHPSTNLSRMNRPATNQEVYLQLSSTRLPPTSAYRVHFRNAFDPLASSVPVLKPKLRPASLQ